MELVAVVLQALDELLDGAVGLEGEQREAVRDVAPLAKLFRKPESLTQLLDDVLCLLVLLLCFSGVLWCVFRDGIFTFSMNPKMYFMMLWNVSSFTAWAPTDK